MKPKADTLQPAEADARAADLALAINYDQEALKAKVGWYQFLTYLCSNGIQPTKSEYTSHQRISSKFDFSSGCCRFHEETQERIWIQDKNEIQKVEKIRILYGRISSKEIDSEFLFMIIVFKFRFRLRINILERERE